jgi:hypothetical protein
MNPAVSACLVTRGDVDMSPIIDSLPEEWEIIVWNNGARRVYSGRSGRDVAPKAGLFPGIDYTVHDLSVYGRYAAVEYALNDLIFVMDDDVIVSDPQSIVDEWDAYAAVNQTRDHVVCNMPEAHRSQPFYKEHALVGFGAVFHRDAPTRAFDGFFAALKGQYFIHNMDWFYRRCDVVFTALTPRVLVDVPIRNLPYYDAPNRSWKQKDHFRERKEMLRLALQVRDA